MKRLFKKLPLALGIILVLTIVVAGLSGCGTSKTAEGTTPSSTTTEASALVIINGTQAKTLSIADIEKLPVISGQREKYPVQALFQDLTLIRALP